MNNKAQYRRIPFYIFDLSVCQESPSSQLARGSRGTLYNLNLGDYSEVTKRRTRFSRRSFRAPSLLTHRGQAWPYFFPLYGAAFVSIAILFGGRQKKQSASAGRANLLHFQGALAGEPAKPSIKLAFCNILLYAVHSA